MSTYFKTAAERAPEIIALAKETGNDDAVAALNPVDRALLIELRYILLRYRTQAITGDKLTRDAAASLHVAAANINYPILRSYVDDGKEALSLIAWLVAVHDEGKESSEENCLIHMRNLLASIPESKYAEATADAYKKRTAPGEEPKAGKKNA